MLELSANAKINVGLNVVGNKGNMHLIDTVILPINLADKVKMEARDDNEIVINYSDGRRYERDVALVAAKRIMDRYKTRGVNIYIEKNIPEGAGLGGSSADGAAIARGMEKLFSYGKTDRELLLEIGSDVNAQYYNAPCRIEGVGEKVSPIKKSGKYYGLLMVPDYVNTAKAYLKYDEIGGENGEIAEILARLGKGEKFGGFNALERAAKALTPKIAECLAKLKDAGFEPCMTGSGGGVFALETEKRVLLQKLEKARVGQNEAITFIC